MRDERARLINLRDHGVLTAHLRVPGAGSYHELDDVMRELLLPIVVKELDVRVAMIDAALVELGVELPA